MERIFALIEKNRFQYATHIGSRSIVQLCSFISGYEYAIMDLTGERIRFDSLFQNYITNVLQEKNTNQHWDDLLLEKFSADNAFDMFYLKFEKFKEAYQDSDLSVFLIPPHYLECENNMLYELMFVTSEGAYQSLGCYNSKEKVKQALIHYRKQVPYMCNPSGFFVVGKKDRLTIKSQDPN